MNFYFPIVNSIYVFFEKKAFGVCEWLGSIFGINPSISKEIFYLFEFCHSWESTFDIFSISILFRKCR